MAKDKKSQDENFNLILALTHKNTQKVSEINRYLPDIRTALKLGYDRKKIWETLRDNHKITCGYSYFCRTLKDSKEQFGEVKEQPSLPGFKRNPHPNKKDLV
jgi:hypothetical protein